ncbi:MAG: hypothetical protein MRJ93_14190 [Nitrososphaeraceae archaeon]|nr:hypothetical protein [Nitrososphaeraceae archaeon]
MSSNELDGKSIFLVSGTREELSNNIKYVLQDFLKRNFPTYNLNPNILNYGLTIPGSKYFLPKEYRI